MPDQRPINWYNLASGEHFTGADFDKLLPALPTTLLLIE